MGRFLNKMIKNLLYCFTKGLGVTGFKSSNTQSSNCYFVDDKSNLAQPNTANVVRFPSVVTLGKQR